MQKLKSIISLNINNNYYYNYYYYFTFNLHLSELYLKSFNY